MVTSDHELDLITGKQLWQMNHPAPWTDIQGIAQRYRISTNDERGYTMKLSEKQFQFTEALGKLINKAYEMGYTITLGDAYAKTGHKANSFHYKRLAIDLNLFKDGQWLTMTLDHAPLGAFWESIGGTWGGRFKHPDGNHYSWGE